MGFFGRKRIKIAPGIYLNASSSGLGISAGVKGFRISTNSKGDTYLNAGRYGLYYREKLNKKEKSYKSSNNSTSKTKSSYSSYNNSSTKNDFSTILGNNYKINLKENYNSFINLNDDYLYKEANDLIQFQPKESKFNQNQDDMSILGLLCSIIGILLFAMFECWFMVALLIGITILVYQNYNSLLEKNKQNKEKYEETQAENQEKQKELKEKINITTSREQIGFLKDFFSEIKDENKIYSAYSGYSISLGYGTLGGIINSDVPCININEHYIFFTDDRLVIKKNETGEIYNIFYNNLSVNINESSTCIQNPSDNCEILSYTYEHVNKDGSPNKRYKENNQIAEVKTWIISLSCNNCFCLPFAIYDRNIKDIFINLLKNL